MILGTGFYRHAGPGAPPGPGTNHDRETHASVTHCFGCDCARALLAEAGVPNPKLTLSVINAPTDTQVGEVIQAMALEAGFDVVVRKGRASP